MEPCKIRGTTQPLVSRPGAGRQGNIFSFRSRGKNVLDFSFYRSRYYVKDSALARMPSSETRFVIDSVCGVI